MLRWVLTTGARLVEDGAKGVFKRSVVDHFLEEGYGGWDVREIPLVVLIVSDVGKGTEDLHEALRSAVLENGLDGLFFTDVLPEVEELLPILGGVVHVGIVEEGGEVVFLTPHAESLEVDDVGLVILQHEVLRLEITMNHVGSGGPEAFGKAKKKRVSAEFGSVLAKVGFDEMLEEVFLLPAVERFVENGLEF